MAPRWILGLLCACVGALEAPGALPKLAEPRLKLGAFNIQIFGRTKYERNDVLPYIIEILQRYDLILVQEIRDAYEIYMHKLLADLNRNVTGDESKPYSMVISERLGTTTIKEQYAYLFRSDRLTVKNTLQYPLSTGYLEFERPPFMVHFDSPTTELRSFVIIGDHTKPTNALVEIDNLEIAYRLAYEYFKDENILIAGDLNADCSYLHKEEKSQLLLKRERKFKWLIGEDTDTTVGNSDCAYDRFITAGPGWEGAIVTGSVKTYNFEHVYNLPHALAEDVSDHFPIEFDMEGKRHRENHLRVTSKMTVTVETEEEVADVNDIRQIYRQTELFPSWTIQTYKIETRLAFVEAARSGLDATSVLHELIQFNQALGGDVLNPKTLSFVKTYLEDSTFTQKSLVYGLDVNVVHTVDVLVKCRLQSPYFCSVGITKVEHA